MCCMQSALRAELGIFFANCKTLISHAEKEVFRFAVLPKSPQLECRGDGSELRLALASFRRNAARLGVGSR